MTAAAEASARPEQHGHERALVAVLLGRDTARERIAGALRVPGDAACHVLDAKYRPGTGLSVLYDVGGRLVTGHVDLTGTERPRIQWSLFPDDPALPGLLVLCDPEMLAAGLDGAGLGRVRRARGTLLRYRPGRRATFRVQARSRDGQVTTFIAKAFHDDARAAAAYAEGQRLSRIAPVRTGVLAVPAPVGHLPEPRLVFYRPLTGSPLEHQLTSGRVTATARLSVQRAARALAALHGVLDATEVTHRPRPAEREVRRFAARAGAVRAVDPALGRRLESVAALLRERLPQLPTAAVGLVHGDCKPSQFWLQPDRVALLDFDSCGLADPATDVGTFLATLRQAAILPSPAGRALTADPRALAAAFLAAYTGAHTEDPAAFRRRVRIAEAIALERKALRAFARAPSSPAAAGLARAAQQCCDSLDTDE
jgi:aminoglycoside phosphotransferase (APT) family kinase protein